jgi:OmpA-OmpF porin, OOP family
MTMPIPLRMFAVLAALLSLHTVTPLSAQTRDVAGGRDYPGIGRFTGSVITGYVVKDFDAARMQAARSTGGWSW